MAGYIQTRIPPPTPELSGVAAIVGVGETDYHRDYRAAKARAPGYRPPTLETLALEAFERALTDSGLTRDDIDGLAVSSMHTALAPPDMAKLLGVDPRYLVRNGNIMAGPLPTVCGAIGGGQAETVAMIYTVASHGSKPEYGGTAFVGGNDGTPWSYYYFHPWGWSSQAAHWALMCTYYLNQFGLTEQDLAAVPLQLRRNAMNSDHAIMRTPMTLDDYLGARYIVRPIRLFDMCLVNDGAVCLIVRRTDKARDMAKPPILVSGWGECFVQHDKFHHMVRKRLRPQMQDALGQALGMAGLSLSHIQHFEGYDTSSMHLVNQIEGFGFAEPGRGLHGFRNGDFATGGRLPVNTAGGLISGAYMHGWNQVVEVVRQLRHEAGPRQVAGARVSLSSLTQTDVSHPILYTRGE